ncbi:MAG: winged helix-turn-helix domain-containing protein [Pseudomonadota bacterium]
MDNDNALPQSASDSSDCLWVFAGAELNERDLSVKLKGQSVDLDYKSVEVLLVLLRHAGEVVTKDELFETVWAGRVTVEGVLTNAISKLRKALGEDVIATQHRIGYRLTVPVTRKLLSETASELHLNAGDPVPGREAWRLLRALGTGGQGEVWLAEQAKTREQRVFKFAIDAGRLSSLKREATLYRLLRDVLGERRDFARVLEWNFETTPFFLECEYGGLSLVDWADQGAGLASVSLDERLRLMAETAEAVAASHSAGVLHKDLKPGNVLIWRDDAGLEHARLTDFGSSRLLDAAQLDAAGITRLGFTVTQLAGESTSGTPLYRAPELLNGQLPTVQSDVYSLGVMLYQLVVGDLRRPLSPGWEQDVTDPLLRADIAAAAHGKPSERMTAADELARRLRTLDARRIEAIEQSQLAQRAATAEALVQRNRTRRPWIAAAFVALALGLAGSLYFFSQSQTSLRAAREEASNVQLINAFVKDDVLRQASQYASGKDKTTVLEAIIRAAATVEQKFAGRPALAARIHETLGTVFDDRLDRPAALREYGLALGQFQTLYGANSEPALTMELAILRIRTHYDNDEAFTQEKIRSELTRVEAGIRALSNPSTDLLIDLEMDLGRAELEIFYDFAKAVPHYEAALKMAEAQAPRRADYVSIIRWTAVAHSRAGTSDRADKLFTQALDEAARTVGATHPEAMDVRRNFVTHYTRTRRYEEAIVMAEQLLKDRTAFAGETDSDTVLALGGLALSYFGAQRWRDAELTYQKGLDIVRAKGSKPSTRSYFWRTYQAYAIARQGRTTEAVALFTKLKPDARAYWETDEDIPPYNFVDFFYAATLIEAGQTARAKGLLEPLMSKAARIDLAETAADWPQRLHLLALRIQAAEGKSVAADADVLLREMQPFAVPRYWVWEDVQRLAANSL